MHLIDETMITSFAVLDQLLSAIDDTCPMAILHRERDIAAHKIQSDVDLCVAEPPLYVISRVIGDLENSGVFLILVFHYDRGSYSLFFANSHGTGGAQVDLVHDPAGAGLYGVRTNTLLARRTTGARWPRADELDEALYVLRKRQVKGDAARIALARRDLMAFGTTRTTRRATDLFVEPAASSVIGDSRRSSTGRSSVALWRSRLMRPSRVRQRCGYWAHVAGSEAPTVARDLAHRMSRLIKTTTATEPSLSFLMNNLWRPRLVISTGVSRGWMHPDTVLESDHQALDDLGSRLVTSMHMRALRTYKLGSEGNRP